MTWPDENAGGDPLPLFHDRQEAGRELATHLRDHQGTAPVVLGIPRGGVVVAAEVARALNGQLDVIVARKLGAPGAPELAIGAVTADGGRYLNAEMVHALAVPQSYIARVSQVEMAEAQRRQTRLRRGRTAVPLRGRTVIVVDDGVATGATVQAAVTALRHRRPGRIVVAAPVGAREACAALRSHADEVVCPHVPDPFGAIGFFYERFEGVDDAEVERLLQDAGAVGQ